MPTWPSFLIDIAVAPLSLSRVAGAEDAAHTRRWRGAPAGRRRVAGVAPPARRGLLRRIIAGSYPSGPSSLPPPRIWQLIDADEVEAYNIPSGILFHLHREAAAGRPGILTHIGLDTFLDPRRQGGRMNPAARDDLVSLAEFDGQQWLYFRSIPVDVAIIRGTTADALGHVSMEHDGAYLGVYDQALAAHNNGCIVIAQVER